MPDPVADLEPALPLSGPEKALLLILSLEEAVATPVVSELGVDEVAKLRDVARSMREVSADAIDSTYREFVDRSGDSVAVPRGGMTYLKRIAVGALGPRRAHEVFDPASLPTSPMRRLEDAAPEAVATLMEREAPQLVAAVLARMDARCASSVLSAMEGERQAQVLISLARLDKLPAALLEDMATALSDELPVEQSELLVDLDGIAKAAEILNAGKRAESTAMLEEIELDEPDIARDMRLAMFTFEDLVRLDPGGMRDLLREVSTDKLTIALKDASDTIMRVVMTGLSERAAKMILDDMEVLGKVRKSDIEAARREVVQVALRLEAEGNIDLGRDDE